MVCLSDSVLEIKQDHLEGDCFEVLTEFQREIRIDSVEKGQWKE